MSIVDIISKPWPWYVAGPLISFVMFLLLWFGKSFGISSSLRNVCSIAGAGKYYKYFDFNWKKEIWNIIFIAGAILGGYIASSFFQNFDPLELSNNTIDDLSKLGVIFSGELVPNEIFNIQSLTTLKGFLIIVIGGFFIGFGARWAGGCTSGHAISGLSNFQLPSLIAVIGFFIGGLIMTHLIFPYIF